MYELHLIIFFGPLSVILNSHEIHKGCSTRVNHHVEEMNPSEMSNCLNEFLALTGAQGVAMLCVEILFQLRVLRAS